MIGAFESEAKIIFHDSMNKALSSAIQEAAVTNGLVQTINSIKISLDRINFIGNVGRGNFIRMFPNHINIETPYILIRIDAIGNYHTTWHNVLNIVTPLGHLVFIPPIAVIYVGVINEPDYEPNENIVVNIEVARLSNTLNQRTLGDSLCENCGNIINPKQLNVIPNTIYCTQCMKSIEKGGLSNGKSW